MLLFLSFHDQRQRPFITPIDTVMTCLISETERECEWIILQRSRLKCKNQLSLAPHRRWQAHYVRKWKADVIDIVEEGGWK